MSSGLEATLIGILTLIGTLGVQIYGIHKNSSDNEDARAQQSERTLNERFTVIAAQLGDAQPAVRLAGVYAMVRLADDWEGNRQPCVDVLCAYLRMPYEPDPGEDTAPKDRAEYLANREVRHGIIRLIRDHLRPDVDSGRSWQGLDLDFTAVVFDGGDFTEAQFSGGTVRFDEASFASGTVNFKAAEFSGAEVRFIRAKFTGGEVCFDEAGFSGSMVYFDRAKFTDGKVRFLSAKFTGGEVRFIAAEHTERCKINFLGADPPSLPSVVFSPRRIPDGVVLPKAARAARQAELPES